MLSQVLLLTYILTCVLSQAMLLTDILTQALLSPHQQLLSPSGTQFLIAGQNGLATPTPMPVQHLLIPVSTGTGSQQLVSIPLSLAAGLGNQMQLLATSGGQLIATNMATAAGLTQLNLATLPTSG